MRKPLLFERVRCSKKLAEKCSAALKSMILITLIKSVEDENNFIG